MFPNSKSRSVFSLKKVMGLGVLVLLAILLIALFPVVSNNYTTFMKTGQPDKSRDLQQKALSPVSETLLAAGDHNKIASLSPDTHEKIFTSPAHNPGVSSGDIDHGSAVPIDTE